MIIAEAMNIDRLRSLLIMQGMNIDHDMAERLLILQYSGFYIVKDNMSQIFACKQANKNL